MNRIVFFNPGMPVDPCSFIKPSFVLSGINPDNDDIFPPLFYIVSNIVVEFRITTHMGAKIMTINPDFAVAENAVKFYS